MGKFDSFRKEKSFVLPSGVSITMKSLMGEHQTLITNADEKKRKSAIDEMLLDCTVSLGYNSNLTIKDIEKMLSSDRAYALFQLRQFSNETSDQFVFDYEFPVDKNGNKRKQRYIVEFNKRDFPAKPYYWVYRNMVQEWKKLKDIKNDLTEDDEADMLESMDFPILYNSYEEMLSEHFNQELILPNSEVKVYWTLLDGEKEKKYAELKKEKDINSHDQIILRNPKYKEDDHSEGQPMLNVPLNKLTQIDIEALRGDIISKEANIDTSIVVQYRDNVNVQASLNLITVPSFFFPSLAR